MGEAEGVLTIYTSFGYAKVICAADTTVKELIGMAMRTVSLTSSSQLYGLQMPRDTVSLNAFRHILCRNLTWSEIKEYYNPNELILTICLYPTKFEEAARNDRSTLFYLRQQAKEIYNAHFKDITDVAMAFEIGCLEIRSFASTSDPPVKDLLDMLEKGRGLNSFFPPCVLQAYKSKALRRAVHNYLVKVQHYSEEDCALDMLNRYLVLLKFDRDVIKCTFGAGHGIPVELVIGPRFQVSVMVENTTEPRIVAYFASIRQVMVSKPDAVRFQIRLNIEQSSEPNAPLDTLTFTFMSEEAADTVVHLLEGYCGEAVGAAMQDNMSEFGTASVTRTAQFAKELFLPNGCPYRLKESPSSQMQKFEISRDCLKLEVVIGEGQFGEVWKGVYRKNLNSETISVAVKTCKLNASQEERSQFLEEARILGEFNHPHIIRLIGVCSLEPICLVMEYAPFGELRNYLLTRQGQIALSSLLTFCYQIVTALTCLEAKKCVHQDIAARNILVARDDWVKLADFGMARMLNDAKEFRADKGRKMPIKWMAPESVHQRVFSSASDVWMFGVCMWEILSGGTKPFADLTNAEAADHVTRGQRLKRPANCPPNLYVLMLECWSTNPQRRPTFASLKPRLRELAAESRNSEASDYLNNDHAASPESPENMQVNFSKTYPTSNHMNSGKISPTRKTHSRSHHHSVDRKCNMPAMNISSTAKLPSLHSHWNEVTQFEPIGRSAVTGGTQKPIVAVNVENNANSNSRSRSVGNTHRAGRQRSPERGNMHGTHLETNVSNCPNLANSGQPLLRVSPTVSRDASPRRNPNTRYDLPVFGQNRSPTERKTTPIRLNEFLELTEPSSPKYTSNDAVNHKRHASENNLGTESSDNNNSNGCWNQVHSGNSQSSAELQSQSMLYEEEPNELNSDRIYLSTVQVVKTVRIASQQLAIAPVEKYPLLVKSIGASVRDLFTSIEAEFGTGQLENGIFLAERQLNASMFQLISTIKDAKLAINRGPLLEEYRRHLLTLSYAIAADAHSLYTSVHEYRHRVPSSQTSTSQ